MNTFLTVIVPCFNHGLYLRRAIESVLHQAGEDCQIIVVDDGSTDNTPAIARNLPNRVTYLRQSNGGPARARNAGLAEARGKYVAFLDADDVWFPDFMREMIPALDRAHEKTAAVACGWQLISPAEVPVGPPRHVPVESISWSELIQRNLFPVHSVIARANAIKEVGSFDSEIVGVEDWDLWLRVVGAGYEISVIRSPLVGYRVLPRSISRNAISMFENSLKVLDKAFSSPRGFECCPQKRKEIYALRYMEAGAGCSASGDEKAATVYLRRGIQIWPGLLEDGRTLYALVCARQPTALKATGDCLDLGEAEPRTKSLLLGLRESQPEEVSRAMPRLYAVLANLARVQGNGSAARRYALQAARLSNGAQLLENIVTWGKTWADWWRKGWAASTGTNWKEG